MLPGSDQTGKRKMHTEQVDDQRSTKSIKTQTGIVQKIYE